ncbi:hypothetical protein AVEN_163712-1 [Araneus ventricosus]|uniref:Uncharacterized protein n=1 Tax=Araneus ventricosus TaxID=182803 RepID=A0A4Y2I0J8_ARAVE|nr:hypothetical protein AVEN_163712-1 [Araneus ventricosus]
MLNMSLSSYPAKISGRRSCQSSHELWSTSAASPHSDRKVMLFRMRNLSSHPLLAEKFSIPRVSASSFALLNHKSTDRNFLRPSSFKPFQNSLVYVDILLVSHPFDTTKFEVYILFQNQIFFFNDFVDLRSSAVK